MLTCQTSLKNGKFDDGEMWFVVTFATASHPIWNSETSLMLIKRSRWQYLFFLALLQTYACIAYNTAFLLTYDGWLSDGPCQSLLRHD